MLRGGIIGFGRMGVTHFALLNTHRDVKLTAVCDSSSFVLHNLSRFSDARVFSDADQMLKEAELDFVIVATPTASHADLIEAAVARGLHVFVEKPLAVTTASGQHLVERAAAAGIVNQVGYFLRFNEMFDLLKQHVDTGRIGIPIHYRSEMYGRAVLKASKSSWRSKKKEGGGCLLDFASHCIDLSDWLFGPPHAVRGSLLRTVYSTSVEDAAYATLVYDNGLTGQILVNWSDATFRRPYNRIEILGTGGKIVADRQECRLFLNRAHEEAGLPKGWSVKYLPEVHRRVRFDIRGTEFTAQLDHFIECIQRGDPRNACSFADALRTDCVMHAIEEDARSGAGIPIEGSTAVGITPRATEPSRRLGRLIGRMGFGKASEA